jgi:hypothetical protein
VRAARVGSRKEPLEPPVELLEQPRTATHGAQPVDLREWPAALLPELAGRARALDPRSAELRLELVREVR